MIDKEALVKELAGRIIDSTQEEFKQFPSLNGEVLLKKDYDSAGNLIAIQSVSVNTLIDKLAASVTDTKNDGGWKEHFDKFAEDGIDLTPFVEVI